MNDAPDDRLVTDEEWATLMAAKYDAAGAPVDKVAKARVWRRLATPRGIAARGRWQTPRWAAAAASLVAVLGVTLLWQRQGGWREKGDGGLLAATLTPYILEPTGATRPVEFPLAPGSTVVFRAHAPAAGVYVLVVAEGAGAPRIAVDEGGTIDAEDRLITKDGDVFGMRVEAEATVRVCVVATTDRDGAVAFLAGLPARFATLPPEACASLATPAP